MTSANAIMYELQQTLRSIGVAATHHGTFLRMTREEVEKPWVPKILADYGCFIEFQGPAVTVFR